MENWSSSPPHITAICTRLFQDSIKAESLSLLSLKTAGVVDNSWKFTWQRKYPILHKDNHNRNKVLLHPLSHCTAQCLLMFLPEHVLLVKASCSRTLCSFISHIQVFSAGLTFETSDFEIAASVSILIIAESTGLYKHYPSGVFLCACSPNAPRGRFSLCHGLYQHRGKTVGFGKPALFCSEIFLSLVSLCLYPHTHFLCLSLSLMATDSSGVFIRSLQ